MRSLISLLLFLFVQNTIFSQINWNSNDYEIIIDCKLIDSLLENGFTQTSFFSQEEIEGQFPTDFAGVDLTTSLLAPSQFSQFLFTTDSSITFNLTPVIAFTQPNQIFPDPQIGYISNENVLAVQYEDVGVDITFFSDEPVNYPDRLDCTFGIVSDGSFFIRYDSFGMDLNQNFIEGLGLFSDKPESGNAADTVWFPVGLEITSRNLSVRLNEVAPNEFTFNDGPIREAGLKYLRDTSVCVYIKRKETSTIFTPLSQRGPCQQQLKDILTQNSASYHISRILLDGKIIEVVPDMYNVLPRGYYQLTHFRPDGQACSHNFYLIYD